MLTFHYYSMKNSIKPFQVLDEPVRDWKPSLYKTSNLAIQRLKRRKDIINYWRSKQISHLGLSGYKNLMPKIQTSRAKD